MFVEAASILFILHSAIALVSLSAAALTSAFVAIFAASLACTLGTTLVALGVYYGLTMKIRQSYMFSRGNAKAGVGAMGGLSETECNPALPYHGAIARGETANLMTTAPLGKVRLLSYYL